jgi:hypothetical protein
MTLALRTLSISAIAYSLITAGYARTAKRHRGRGALLGNRDFRDGRVILIELFFEREEALKAVGPAG